MIITNETVFHVPVATTVKPCPFCGDRGAVTQVDDPPKFGVRCGGCRVCLLETFQSIEKAVAAWCQRRGTVSAAGGRGTKGKSSWKKRRSSCRNLRIARRKKKMKWIMARIDVMASQVKTFREIEHADLEAAIAADRAELKVLEPKIMSDPLLRVMYELLPKRDVLAAVDRQNRGLGGSDNTLPVS